MNEPQTTSSEASRASQRERGLTSSLFIGSSLPIRSQAGSPAPGQNPNSGQRSRNSSGTGSINKGTFLSFFVQWEIEFKDSVLYQFQ